jgi:hypothetical protein
VDTKVDHQPAAVEPKPEVVEGTHQSEVGDSRSPPHEATDRTAAQRSLQRRDGAELQDDVGNLWKLATLGHWMIKKKADEVMDNFVAKMKGQLENEVAGKGREVINLAEKICVG